MNPIRELRHAQNLSQVAASKRAGLTQTDWSRIERRESLDTTELGSLRKIAKALGVKVERLI